MEIQFARTSRIIESIQKIYLTKEERAALQSLIDLPQELKSIVEDKNFTVNKDIFKGSQINEDGYPLDHHRVPVVWLNPPAVCRRHLEEHPSNTLRMIYRRPKLNTQIRYDFPRLLIAKGYKVIPPYGATYPNYPVVGMIQSMNK